MNSDLVWLLALAAVSITRNSSTVTRIRSIADFVLPLGSGGRPGLLGFGFDVGIGPHLLQLLHDGDPDGGYR